MRARRVPFQDRPIVGRDLVGLAERADVLAQSREEDSDAVVAESLGGGVGVLDPLARHEPPHGALREGQVRDGLPHALVAGHPQECRAHRSHGPMVPLGSAGRVAVAPGGPVVHCRESFAAGHAMAVRRGSHGVGHLDRVDAERSIPARATGRIGYLSRPAGRNRESAGPAVEKSHGEGTRSAARGSHWAWSSDLPLRLRCSTRASLVGWSPTSSLGLASGGASAREAASTSASASERA